MDILSHMQIIRIGLIILGGFFGYWLIMGLVQRATIRTERMRQLKLFNGDEAAVEQRVNTLKRITQNVARIAVLAVVVLMVLEELGIDVTPILAGAGIVGVAVGFGSQTLVKDFLSGMFILAEGQYSIGDVVDIAGKKGKVVDVSIRRTVLRDANGVEHHVPNSAISTVSNYTKDSAGLAIVLPLPFKTSTATVAKISQEVIDDFMKNEEYTKVFIEPPKVVGVTDYTTNGVLFRISGSMHVAGHTKVERNLRTMLIQRLHDEEIELGGSGTVI